MGAGVELLAFELLLDCKFSPELKISFQSDSVTVSYPDFALLGKY
jgi:hypothetical protein